MMKFSCSFFRAIIMILAIGISCAWGQQILDEMQLIDISKEQSILSTIVRDPNQALLIIKTQISGLRIQSNNTIYKTEQPEPGTWHIFLAPGTHRLSFQAEGFISIQERFYFNPKDVKGIRIHVIPTAEKKEEKNTGIIVIKSTPDSAAVYINEQFYGITPYLGKTITGQYKLELRKEPFLPYEETIIIISGETLPLNIELSKSMGSVEISSRPAGASVEINDREIGQTPLEFKKLGKGKFKLKVTKKYHEVFEAEFEINEKNRSQKFNISLIPQESKLTVLGTPPGAQVYIDGNKIGILPVENSKIYYGPHELSVGKPGFYTLDKMIVIDKKDPFKFDIILNPKSRYSSLLYSTILPGSGQIYSGRKTKGIILGAATISGAAAAYFLYNNYTNKKDDYLVNKNAYETNFDLAKMATLYNAMQKSYDPMKDAQKTAQIALGITAAIWIYNIIDSILFFPDQGGMAVRTDSNADYLNIGLCIKL